MININLPKITATNPEGQIQQMHSYLYQVVEQLNWALSSIDTNSSEYNPSSSAVELTQDETLTPEEAENTFNSIKALIIKSADIVKAYEETILKEFNGKYFADSDFGTYLEETKRVIEENSKGTTDFYTHKQTIDSKVEGIEDAVLNTEAYIKKGFLDYDKETGEPIYGIAVGETIDGAYRKYAWFTADRLSFFDANDDEVAYIGSGCLYIVGTSRFIGDVYFGGYRVDTSDGLAFTWHE